MSFAVIEECNGGDNDISIRTFSGNPSFKIEGNKLKVTTNGSTTHFGNDKTYITVLMEGRVIARSNIHGGNIIILRQ